jgi:hypothetical protein
MSLCGLGEMIRFLRFLVSANTLLAGLLLLGSQSIGLIVPTQCVLATEAIECILIDGISLFGRWLMLLSTRW